MASLWEHQTRLPCPVRCAWTSCSTVASSVGFISFSASNTCSSLSPGMVSSPTPVLLLSRDARAIGETGHDVQRAIQVRQAPQPAPLAGDAAATSRASPPKGTPGQRLPVVIGPLFVQQALITSRNRVRFRGLTDIYSVAGRNVPTPGAKKVDRPRELLA